MYECNSRQLTKLKRLKCNNTYKHVEYKTKKDLVNYEVAVDKSTSHPSKNSFQQLKACFKN